MKDQPRLHLLKGNKLNIFLFAINFSCFHLNMVLKKYIILFLLIVLCIIVSFTYIKEPFNAQKTYNYIGCYREDQYPNRHFEIQKPDKVSTVEECKNYAVENNSKYFGLQYHYNQSKSLCFIYFNKTNISDMTIATDCQVPINDRDPETFMEVKE